MHGGTIEAKSDGAGRAATFIVRLPMRAGAGTEVRARQPCPAPMLYRASEFSSSTTTMTRPRAWRCCSNRSARKCARRTTGREALEIVAEFAPAVVLLDIGMPGMDGYEVARRIRAQGMPERPTLIALTGWGQDDDRRRAREAGFDHHLVKPANFRALQALLAAPA